MTTTGDYDTFTHEGMTYERGQAFPRFLCPCCKQPLYSSVTGIPTKANPVHLLCADERCQSEAAHAGAMSPSSLEEAFDKLRGDVGLEKMKLRKEI